MILDITNHILVRDSFIPGVKLRFGMSESGTVWLKLLSFIDMDGALDGPPLNLMPCAEQVVEADLQMGALISSSYYDDRHAFEGFGRVLGVDRDFRVEVAESRIRLLVLAENGRSCLMLDYDTAPESAVAELPPPPRTAWDRLDGLYHAPEAPSVPVAVLAPGWGDDFG